MEDESVNRKRKIGIITIVAIFLLGFSYITIDGLNQIKSLDENGQYVNGTIQHIGFGTVHGPVLYVDYSFIVDGQTFFGADVIEDYCEFYRKIAKSPPGYINEKIGTLNCKVFYDASNPDNNEIIILDEYCD
ncbi:MAG: hypothetical protein H6600_06710 [Flavobacteriales bacterium]|nr:hypothetical protein [Flavobacteriales bacterium]